MADDKNEDFRRRDDALIAAVSEKLGEIGGEVRMIQMRMDTIGIILKETRDMTVAGAQWQKDHDAKEDVDHQRIMRTVESLERKIPDGHEQEHHTLHPVADYFRRKVERQQKRRAWWMGVWAKVSENIFGKVIGWFIVSLIGGIIGWMATHADKVGSKVLKAMQWLKGMWH